MSKITLNELYPDWLNGGGVLSNLTEHFNVPWKGTVDGDTLDLEYHGNRSGKKVIAPLLFNMIDSKDGITEANKLKLSKLLYTRYNTNWVKLWNTLSLEYEPLHNYDMTEDAKNNRGEQTNSSTIGEQVDSVKIGARSDSSTIGEQSNSSTIGSQSNSNTFGAKEDVSELQTAAFNSSNYSDKDKTTNKEGQHQDTQNLGSRSDSQSIGSRSDTSSIGEQNNESRTGSRNDSITEGAREDKSFVRRFGNLGVTTSQQMLQSEVDLWIDWQFFQQIFSDIDFILVTEVFGCDRELDKYVIQSSYTLPPATSDRLGGIKVGNGLNITGDGLLSSQGEVLSVNGKKGAVNITNEDVNAPSMSAFEGLDALVDNNSASIMLLQNNKQNKLTAGANIVIENDVISSKGNDVIIIDRRKFEDITTRNSASFNWNSTNFKSYSGVNEIVELVDFIKNNKNSTTNNIYVYVKDNGYLLPTRISYTPYDDNDGMIIITYKVQVRWTTQPALNANINPTFFLYKVVINPQRQTLDVGYVSATT